MAPKRLRFILSLAILTTLVGHGSPARAQGIEVSPFYGYRFGGDFFELVTGRPVDLDGAPSIGVVLNVPLYDGLQVEGFFTHQKADVWLPTAQPGPAQLWPISVDHWLAGGLQEFGRVGRVRPFATGMLGLARYAAGGNSEIRFSLAAGGGVKVFPSPRIGIRLDGRAFATLIDAHGSALACSVGVCLIALHTNIVWQAEFTAGLVVRLP
jgi:hypothetical protein